MGAGSLWPPPSRHANLLHSDKELFVLYTWKGQRPPLIFGFTVSNYYRYCLLFFDPCPCPASASGTDDTPSTALCLQNQIGGFFFFFGRILLFSLSGKSFICKKYGDHPYEDLENSGYNPDMKIK